MRIFPILFLLLFTLSCATRNIQYDREKVLSEYSKGFDILVDEQKVNFGNLFLDKSNIAKATINRKKKDLKITQYKTPELIKLSEIYLDSLSNSNGGWKKKKIGFIIIDGILQTDKTIDEISIDPKAITQFRIQKGEDSKDSRIFRMDRDYLIITTK